MAKKSKIKPLATRLEFESAVDQIAELDTLLRSHLAQRDLELQLIQSSYAPLEAEVDKQLKDLVKVTAAYADEHREEIFPPELKSSATALAVYGFRLGKQTLSLLNKTWSWEKVLAALKARKHRRQFIRTTEEVDKEKLKAVRARAGTLARLGLKLTQTETFYVEPKSDAAQTVKTESP